jgi:hypothetical protein
MEKDGQAVFFFQPPAPQSRLNQKVQKYGVRSHLSKSSDGKTHQVKGSHEILIYLCNTHD